MRYKKFYLSAMVMAFLIAVYCAFANNDRTYDYIFLLPLVYSVALFFLMAALWGRENYGVTFVFHASQILIFLRYVVTPFFVVFSSSYTHWGWGPDPDEKTVLFAEILMCLELVLIFVTQYYAIRRFSRKKANTPKEDTASGEKYGLLIIYAAVALALVLLVQPALLVLDTSFVFSGGRTLEDVPLQGMFVILAETFEMVFMIISLILCKRAYDKKNNRVFILLAVISIIVVMALNTSSNRIQMLVPLVFGAYFLVYIFGKIPVSFVVSGGILASIYLLTVSVSKFNYAVSSAANPIREIIVIMSGQFQDYFSGPRIVAQMMEVARIYDDAIGFSTFVNDFTGSIPFISNFVDQTNRINYYFNTYCGTLNQTLIAPVLGIGYAYCPIFPFFFSMGFEYLAIKFDYLTSQTRSIKFRYVYAYIGFINALCMCYSTQGVMAKYVNTFLPLWVLFKVSDGLTIKKGIEGL